MINIAITRSRLFQKCVEHTKLDFYIFITITGSIPLRSRGYHWPSCQCFPSDMVYLIYLLMKFTWYLCWQIKQYIACCFKLIEGRTNKHWIWWYTCILIVDSKIDSDSRYTYPRDRKKIVYWHSWFGGTTAINVLGINMSK